MHLLIIRNYFILRFISECNDDVTILSYTDKSLKSCSYIPVKKCGELQKILIIWYQVDVSEPLEFVRAPKFVKQCLPNSNVKSYW